MTFIKYVCHVDGCEYLVFSCEDMANEVWDLLNSFNIYPRNIVCFNGYCNAIQL